MSGSGKDSLLSFPHRPDRLRVPLIIVPRGYCGLFPWVYSGRSVNVVINWCVELYIHSPTCLHGMYNENLTLRSTSFTSKITYQRIMYYTVTTKSAWQHSKLCKHNIRHESHLRHSQPRNVASLTGNPRYVLTPIQGISQTFVLFTTSNNEFTQ